MTFYKVSELTNLFVANNNFINPVRSDNKRSSSISLFTSNAIGKLKILATQLSGAVVTGVEWQNLLQAIDKVEEANKDISHAALKFKEYYHQSYPVNDDKKCDIVKQEIKDTLLSLFRVSMFMRGWDDTRSSLPIEISLVRDSEQSTVDLRVTQEMAILYKLLNTSGKIVGDLPLVRYFDSHFIPSNSKDDGISIKDRLDIVKKGTTNASCIRLSSNWLAASTYHYTIILNLNKPFNITKLRVIS